MLEKVFVVEAEEDAAPKADNQIARFKRWKRGRLLSSV
jgi:hypothetical protein